MAPLRTELSTVSLPPRERILGNRRAKAIKHGQELPSSINGSKRMAKAPAPTLASTRERRAAADVAYLSGPEGYHIKRVVRRPPTPEPVPVPYLMGQDDIPHSDEESDDGTATTVLDVLLEHPESDIDSRAKAVTVQSEAVDYSAESMEYDMEDADADAEGEDEDKIMQDRASPAFTPTNHVFNAGWDAQPGLVPTNDLIGDASEEDMRALFDGLDNIPTDFPTGFPDFPTGLPVANGPMLGGGFADVFHAPMLGIPISEPFAMHEMHAAVDDLQVSGLPRGHSHSGSSCADHPPQPPVTVDHSAAKPQVPSTHQSLLITPTIPLARPSPLPRRATQAARASRAGTPIDLFDLSRTAAPARQAPRLSTRDLAAQARAQARSPSFPIPPPPPTPCVDLHAESLTPLRRPPLRRSLSLLDFMRDEIEDSLSDNDQPRDHEASRPSTPVALEDTDIPLNRALPAPVTQARARAIRFLNVRVLPRRASLSSLRIPTALDLQVNASKVFKLGRRRNRSRYHTPTSSARNRSILSSAALSDDQHIVMPQMEYHVMKDVLCTNPWPEIEERAVYLSDAQRYAGEQTGITGDDVFTSKFLDTVFYRMSGNRGNSLARIECMMEHEFEIAAGDKSSLFQLMDKDLFLFPSVDREPSSYFCVGALSSALEIILFKSSKPVGLAFMEDLCKPDNTEKCAHWHRKLVDRSARKGVPPGLLAFAATQMYWALEKMYMGSTVHFDEQHYRGVWDRYFRALVKLPHLGRLRVDMLDRIKEYYMSHWPAEEPYGDEESFPAW